MFVQLFYAVRDINAGLVLLIWFPDSTPPLIKLVENFIEYLPEYLTES